MKLQRLIPLALLGVALGLASAHGTAAVPADPAAARSGDAIAPGGAQAKAVCVWSCQYNPNFGTWKYWFAPSLSACTVNKCQPRGGSSPSGTACNQGDPDIPGDCVP